MIRKEFKALIIESDASRAKRIVSLLKCSNEPLFDCQSSPSLSGAKKIIQEDRLDIVISALELVDAKGLDSLVWLNRIRSEIPVVAIAEGAELDPVLNAARSLSDDCLFWEELGEDYLSQSVLYALERREMLRELRVQHSGNESSKANLFFRGILDKIDEAVFVVSRLDGILLYSNETAKRWFGANMGEALEDALEYDLLEVEEVEMEISTRNPNYPRAELRSLWVDWGNERACLISMRDISKQKRAEDAFLSSQRRLDLATRRTGFWSWNLTRNKVWFSENLCKALGYNKQAIRNSVSVFKNALHPNDRERVIGDFRRFQEKPRSDFSLKFRMRFGDGFYGNVRTLGGQVFEGAPHSVVFAGTLFRTDEKREPCLISESQVAGPLEIADADEVEGAGDPSTGGIALIVDDEEVIRKALDPILLSYGFKTLVANDGVEGIELYEKFRDEIEIVILDVNMPRIDGGKVFKRIRADGQRIPIIMTSGNDDKQVLPFSDGQKENCDFLLKPFGLADVKRVVDRFAKKPVSHNVK